MIHLARLQRGLKVGRVRRPEADPSHFGLDRIQLRQCGRVSVQ
jgi:hypothetical protein